MTYFQQFYTQLSTELASEHPNEAQKHTIWGTCLVIDINHWRLLLFLHVFSFPCSTDKVCENIHRGADAAKRQKRHTVEPDSTLRAVFKVFSSRQKKRCEKLCVEAVMFVIMDCLRW